MEKRWERGWDDASVEENEDDSTTRKLLSTCVPQPVRPKGHRSYAILCPLNFFVRKRL